MTSQPHAAPTRVGDYTLLTRLGEGGMGIVHLARGADGRRVALKVLRDHIAGDREARARLAREVGSLQRVRSPWIAEILDADPWGEVPYVVTRYVPGLSLHDHVIEEGPVADRDLLWLAGCLAEGIDAVHTAGVLHRDVKPSNVLMEGRTPILIDFGLARVAEDPRLTRTGWLLGTPGYLAPEILYGDEATAAADVHAWAATVAYAATGRAPYGRGPAMAIMDRARRGEHDLTGIPSPLADVLGAALDPDPLERPLLGELLAWLRPLSTRPAEPEVPPPAGGVLGGGVLGGGAEPDDFTLPLALAGPAGAGEVLGADPPPVSASPATVRDHAPHLAGAPVAPPPPPPPPRTASPAATIGAPGDGQARTLPPAPAPTAVLPQDREPVTGLARLEREWDQQHGYAPPEDGYGFGDPGPRPVPAGERIRRGGAVLAGSFVVGGALAAAPWITTMVVVVTVWLLRAGSLATSAVADRRLARGRKWYDALGLVFSSPWHLLRAVTGTGVLAVWSAGLALAAGLLCYAFALELPATLAISGTTFGVALWSGPGSSRLRSPLSRLVHPLSRTGLPWVLTCAVLVIGGALLTIVAMGQGAVWAPADSGPFGIG